MARVIVPGIPHHLTQRGNGREDVFFGDGDRQRYLQLLLEYSVKHGMETLAYCLMTNHVRFVSVPARADSFARVMKPVDLRYPNTSIGSLAMRPRDHSDSARRSGSSSPSK